MEIALHLLKVLIEVNKIGVSKYSVVDIGKKPGARYKTYHSRILYQLSLQLKTTSQLD